MTDLTLNAYQESTADTAVYPGHGQPGISGLVYCALGLGEAGEIQGKVKKVLRDHGGHLTGDARTAIAKELGDLLWYIARTAEEIEFPLETIAQINLAKLASRRERGTLRGDGDDR